MKRRVKRVDRHWIDTELRHHRRSSYEFSDFGGPTSARLQYTARVAVCPCVPKAYHSTDTEIDQRRLDDHNALFAGLYYEQPSARECAGSGRLRRYLVRLRLDFRMAVKVIYT